VDYKYYVKGLGQVAELSAKGPVERLQLVGGRFLTRDTADG
jgi:hypothetical protein